MARRLTVTERYNRLNEEMKDIYIELGKLDVQRMDKENVPTARNYLMDKLKRAGYDMSRLMGDASLSKSQMEQRDRYYTQLNLLRKSARKKSPGWLGSVLDAYETIRKGRKDGK